MVCDVLLGIPSLLTYVQPNFSPQISSTDIGWTAWLLVYAEPGRCGDVEQRSDCGQ